MFRYNHVWPFAQLQACLDAMKHFLWTEQDGARNAKVPITLYHFTENKCGVTLRFFCNFDAKYVVEMTDYVDSIQCHDDF